MTDDLQDRLAWCMAEGNLSVADLARWLDCPDPTVRGWAAGGRLGLPPRDTAAVQASLMRLEGLIQKRDGFPVPRMSPSGRIQWLARIKQNGKSRR